MNIEKMYKDIQQKLKNATTFEKNNFMENLLKQDKLYYTFLDDLVAYYPINKTEDSLQSNNMYAIKLSSINGVSKNIDTTTELMNEKIMTLKNKIKQSEYDISNLKKINNNLTENAGDLNNLDNTSKKLLSDYLTEYNITRLMFWIKLLIVLLLAYELFSAEENEHDESFKTTYMIIWGITMGALFLFSYAKYVWTNYSSLPKGGVAKATQSTSPLTCSSSPYGCCPDNVTTATKNKLNCGCNESAYGCCPDGTNRNEDGSCGTETMDETMPDCSQSTYGCCPDNITLSNSTGSNCTRRQTNAPLCSTTQYGCCPDGNTVSNSDRSNCVGSCAFSKYGCCPNGVTISNEDRSNCNVPSCASSKYGCCPDGTVSNKTKSNCII
jgi:hypothetical protein